MQLSIYARDTPATEAIGACLALSRPRQAIVHLEGDLGAGKTTFVRGFIHASGHQGVVKSPTYTLVEPYLESANAIYHFDLYRLNDPQELEYIGARELFGAAVVCLIEWPDRGGAVTPAADLIISLQPSKEGRQITIRCVSTTGTAWLTSAMACLQDIS